MNETGRPMLCDVIVKNETDFSLDIFVEDKGSKVIIHIKRGKDE